MKPSEIYYSQDSIKDKFDNGYTIYSTYNACVKHPFVIDKIPRIRICKKNGKWYTLDNRRLWVFKKLEANGHITDVKVNTVSHANLPTANLPLRMEERMFVSDQQTFSCFKFEKINQKISTHCHSLK